MCSSIASRIRSIASSRLSPTATQPGRSGTYAPTDVSPCSRITTYSIWHLWLVKAIICLTQQPERVDYDLRGGATRSGDAGSCVGQWCGRAKEESLQVTDASGVHRG